MAPLQYARTKRTTVVRRRRPPGRTTHRSSPQHKTSVLDVATKEDRNVDEGVHAAEGPTVQQETAIIPHRRRGSTLRRPRSQIKVAELGPAIEEDDKDGEDTQTVDNPTVPQRAVMNCHRHERAADSEGTARGDESGGENIPAAEEPAALQSKFLTTLPLEVRDMIYTFTMEDFPTVLLIDDKNFPTDLYSYTLYPRTLPPVCFVNKQVWTEASLAYVRRTRFTFGGCTDAECSFARFLRARYNKGAGLEAIRMLGHSPAQHIHHGPLQDQTWTTQPKLQCDWSTQPQNSS
jgi:hypothetical protein